MGLKKLKFFFGFAEMMTFPAVFFTNTAYVPRNPSNGGYKVFMPRGARFAQL